MTKILIVEDDKNMALLFEEFVKDEGYTITKADEGNKAIDILKKESFDLMLLDLKLPDMDGFDVMRNLGENNQNCAVIVITGQGSMNTAVEAMKLGARDFLVKPTTIFPILRLRSFISSAKQKIAIISEATVMSNPPSLGKPLFTPPKDNTILRRALSFISTTLFQLTLLTSKPNVLSQ